MARLFLSYSHDSEPHREHVLQVALRLLEAGHEVVLDRFTPEPDPNWPQWMARDLLGADVVLCVCTPTYRARFEGTASTGGFGVAWEGHLITTELYGRKGKPGRFVPVLSGDADAVPAALRGQPALSLDDADALVAALGGTVGPARPVPEVRPGWTEALSVGALVGPIWRPLRGPKGDEGYAPTQLLRAEHAVVPFMGRKGLLDDLDRWCHGGGVRVRLIIGPGGAGKTRLALEVAARRCSEGWRAGPLAVWRDAHAPTEYLDALLRNPIPLFLIVDYAETRSEVLVPLLQRLAAAGGASARVVLVARARGDWWDRAMAEVPELDRMSFGWPELRVDEVEAGVEQAQAAAKSFAKLLGRPVPREVGDRGRTALDRQVEALVAVLGGGPLEGMAQLLRHEDRFLLNAGALAGVPEAVGRLLPKLMALVTLAGGLGDGEVRDWLPFVDGLDDLRKAEAAAVVELLVELYPRDDGGLDVMRPDRVGEALVLREDGDGRLAVVAADGGRGKAALGLLTRLGAAGEERPFRALLEKRRAKLAGTILDGACELGDPAGRLLAQSLTERPDPELCMALATTLPRSSQVLSELAIVVLQHALAATKDEGARLALMTNLTVALAEAGDNPRAASLSRDVVARLRGPGGAPPEGLLATALGNLCAHLNRTGRYEEALSAGAEAVALFRSYNEVAPGRWDEELCTALGNLGGCLAALGRFDDSLRASREALEIAQRRYSADGLEGAPGLVAALANLANRLLDRGRKRKGTKLLIQAVELSRTVARANPDAGDKMLAEALVTLGSAFWESGDPEGGRACANEACLILDRLGAVRPAAVSGERIRAHALRAHLLEALHDDAGAARSAACALGAVALARGETDPRLLELCDSIRDRYRRACRAAGIPPDPTLLSDE